MKRLPIGWLALSIVLLLSSPAPALRADLNADGRVDLLDLAILAEEWLMSEYGPELVDDGGFALDLMAPSPWTAAGDADIFSGKGEIVGTGSLTQPIDVTVGKTYRVIYTVSGYDNGTLNIHLGSTAGTPRTENGTFTESLVAAGDAQIQFSASSSVLYIDDVSVTEIIRYPVIEAIARDIETAINAITVANGFTQTLTAIRPRRLDFSGILLNDGKVFIWQGDHRPVGEPANLAAEWLVTFEIGAVVIDSDTETDSIDMRINQAAADICRKLAEDVTRGGYALDTLIPSIAKFDTDEATGVIITADIHYRTQYDDPYTQI